MGELEFDRVVEIARSYQESRILLTALELDVFGILRDTPASAKDVANSKGWNEQALAMLLDSLAVMGFLEKCRGLYVVPRVNRDLFSENDSRRMMHIVKHFASGWDAWSTLTRRIVGVGELPRASDLLHGVETLHAHTQPFAPGVAALVRPELGRTFLDLGGGAGTFTIAFLDRDRSLRASLLERSAVLEIARGHLKEAGYEDVELIVSEDLKDNWPGEQDLVFMSAVLHTRTPVTCQSLLHNAFLSLRSGGRVVIRDYVMSEDRLFPRSGTLSSLRMLVSTDGARPYSYGELRAWLEVAGFDNVRLIQDGERMNGIIEAFKP